MQYGYFDDQKKEYVITNLFTPTKWINYIGTLAFGGFVDHTGGSLICKGDPALNRITKYIPQLPASDFRGEGLYLRIHETDAYKVVSPFYTPCSSPLNAYECHVGLGYTRIITELHGIRCDVTIFIPIDSSCEIRWYKFTNLSDKPITLDAVPVVEYTHFDALKQFTNADWVPQTMQSEAIYQENTLILSQYAFMRKNTHVNYFCGNLIADSFETDRKKFLGNNEYGGWANPQSLLQASLENTEARRGDNIAAILYSLKTLAAGETKTLITQLGQTDNIDYASSIPFFLDERNVIAAFNQLNTYWDTYLAKFTVETPDPAFNSLINIHNPHQSYITLNWSRYLSLYQLGLGSRGLGTRDSSQDVLAVLHAVPCEAKALLRKLLAIQMRKGYAMHQVYPLSMEASMGDAVEDLERLQYYSDDHLWLVMAVVAYIKETGHFKFLDEQIPFYDKDKEGNPLELATVREHLYRAVEFSKNDVGIHGLCRLGFADWNDTFNLLPGAESCLSTCLLGAALLGLIDLAHFENDTDKEQQWTSDYNTIKENFNHHAWDGAWYRSYFDHEGGIFGSRKNHECQIFAYGQAWPVMAGFADETQAKSALQAVKDHLNTDHGIKLSTPGFNGYDPSKGGVTTYPPGAKENSGIFMHVNPWVIIAETLVQNGDQAFQYHSQTNPAKKNEIADIYECEPYVYAQNILSDEHPQFGLARNSWLSGTSTWMYTAATQYILGLQPAFDGLILSPCLPGQWQEVKITRHFRNAILNITYQRSQAEKDSFIFITVDGKPIKGNKIPILSSGDHEILVLIH